MFHTIDITLSLTHAAFGKPEGRGGGGEFNRGKNILRQKTERSEANKNEFAKKGGK